MENEKVEVIPVAIGALGTVTKQFEKWIKKLDLGLMIEALQKSCLLGMARIVQKILDMKLEKKATIPGDNWLVSAIVAFFTKK